MAWNLVPNDAPDSQTVVLPLSGANVKIGILMPHTGNLSTEFVESMWSPLKAIGLDWCDKQFFMSRAPSLPLARNLLLEKASQSDCDYLLWMDSDMVPENPIDPNEALKTMYGLCQQKPIVTGLYRAKQQHGFGWAIWIHRDGFVCNKCSKAFDGVTDGKCPDEKCDGEIIWKSGYIHVDNWTGNWFQVDVAGMGWCMMTKEVIDAVYGEYVKECDILDNFKGGYPGNKNFLSVKTPFHWDISGEISEDFYMLTRARMLGYEIWCFADIKLSHLGTLVVGTDGKFRTLNI